jgi:hypothetical protein
VARFNEAAYNLTFEAIATAGRAFIALSNIQSASETVDRLLPDKVKGDEDPTTRIRSEQES